MVDVGTDPPKIDLRMIGRHHRIADLQLAGLAMTQIPGPGSE